MNKFSTSSIKTVLLIAVVVLMSITQLVINDGFLQTVYAKSDSSGWISGDAWSKVYGTDPEAEEEEKTEPDEPGFVESALADMVVSVAVSIDYFESLAGMDIDSVIYGRVGTGKSVNIYGFELQAGNPLGVSAAKYYVILKRYAYAFMALIFLIMLIGQVFNGGSGRERSEFKNKMTKFIIYFVSFNAMPYLINLLIFLRDSILSDFKNTNMSLFDTFYEPWITGDESKQTLFMALMTLGVTIFALWLVFSYAGVAFNLTIHFILFPFVVVMDGTGNNQIKTWIGDVVSLVSTPVIDLILLSSIAAVGKSPSVTGVAGAFLQLCLCMLVIPSRDKAKRILGMSSGGDMGLNGLRAVMAGQQTWKAAKGVAGKMSDLNSQRKDANENADIESEKQHIDDEEQSRIHDEEEQNRSEMEEKYTSSDDGDNISDDSYSSSEDSISDDNYEYEPDNNDVASSDGSDHIDDVNATDTATDHINDESDSSAGTDSVNINKNSGSSSGSSKTSKNGGSSSGSSKTSKNGSGSQSQDGLIRDNKQTKNGNLNNTNSSTGENATDTKNGTSGNSIADGNVDSQNSGSGNSIEDVIQERMDQQQEEINNLEQQKDAINTEIASENGKHDQTMSALNSEQSNLQGAMADSKAVIAKGDKAIAQAATVEANARAEMAEIDEQLEELGQSDLEKTKALKKQRSKLNTTAAKAHATQAAIRSGSEYQSAKEQIASGEQRLKEIESEKNNENARHADAVDGYRKQLADTNSMITKGKQELTEMKNDLSALQEFGNAGGNSGGGYNSGSKPYGNSSPRRTDSGNRGPAAGRPNTGNMSGNIGSPSDNGTINATGVLDAGEGTSFDERRRQVYAQRANVNNFERPEFFNSLSSQQKADLYRQKAKQLGRQQIQLGAGTAVGSLLGAGAGMMLGAQAQALTMEIGGELGTKAAQGVGIGIDVAGRGLQRAGNAFAQTNAGHALNEKIDAASFGVNIAAKQVSNQVSNAMSQAVGKVRTGIDNYMPDALRPYDTTDTQTQGAVDTQGVTYTNAGSHSTVKPLPTAGSVSGVKQPSGNYSSSSYERSVPDSKLFDGYKTSVTGEAPVETRVDGGLAADDAVYRTGGEYASALTANIQSMISSGKKGKIDTMLPSSENTTRKVIEIVQKSDDYLKAQNSIKKDAAVDLSIDAIEALAQVSSELTEDEIIELILGNK